MYFFLISSVKSNNVFDITRFIKFFFKELAVSKYEIILDSFRPHAKPLGFDETILEPFPAAKTIIDKDIKLKIDIKFKIILYHFF